MTGVHGQKAEFLVFLDRPASQIGGPTVVACEPRRERQGCIGGVEIESREAFPSREFLYVHVFPHSSLHAT